MTSLLANAGTPFIWGSCLILGLGNLLIGLLEAHVLRRRYGIENPHLTLWLVLANYATAILGYLVVPWWLGIWESFAKLVRFHLEIAVVVLAWIVTFVATAFLEWWVVHRSAEKKMAAWKSLRASFLMNSASYACLLPIAVWTSDWSGPRNLKSRTVTYKMDRATPQGYILFVDSESNLVRKIRLDRSREEILGKLTESQAAGSHAPLAMVVSPTGRNHLKFVNWPFDSEPSLAIDFDPMGRTEQLVGDEGWKAPMTGGYSVRRFEPRDKGEFEVSTMFWPGYDFHVTNKKSGDSFDLSFQSPFLVWHWTNHTLLPDGWCIAEMDGGIYLIDLRRRQIGLIERGHGAMVVLDD